MSHKAEKKRLLDATNFVSGGNILVVIQKQDVQNHTFFMPYNPFDEPDSVTTSFHDWLLEENNNVDALTGIGPLFTYEKESEVSTVETIFFSGMIPVWAYRVRLLMTESTGCLRFTTSEALFQKISGTDVESVARLIGESYNFLFLADEYRFGDSGSLGYGKILDFCATKLVAGQVHIYPPLSLLYFLADKHGLRDPPLSELMLPNVIVPTQDTFQKTAVAAAALLKKKYPGHTLGFSNKLVAKVSNSCAGLGVFFLERTKDKKNRKKWSVMRDGERVADKIEDPMTGLKIGQPLKFEPFVDDLSAGEWRFYSYLQHHGADKGLSNIYGIKTQMKPSDGRVRIKKMPYTYLHGPGDDINLEDRKQIKQLCRSAIDCLVSTRAPSWRGIRYLVFRFDCFICTADKRVYLNEIDLFPVAQPLMDDYNGCESFIRRMAQCTLDYMIEHSLDSCPWSM